MKNDLFQVDDVGENGVFILPLDVVILPVIGQLVAGFLPHHPLLDPLLAAPVLLPEFTGAVKRTGRIIYVL
jgi:hypothetical protein